MTPTATLIHDDCLEAIRKMPDASVDAIVTDPPYGLSFMGKRWDYDVPSVDIWAECLRVLKPGGHLLAFAGTRTQHRMAVRIEDAGFEIRDMIAWIYASGFPKSLDVSKAIDKAAGAEREVIGQQVRKNDRDANSLKMGRVSDVFDITAPATEAARQWQGWGTALKPALEPITVARKPLVGTVAENVIAHGTGALNIDGCRVGMMTADEVARSGKSTTGMFAKGGLDWSRDGREPTGRWPANLIHDGSEEVVGLFPVTKSGTISTHHQRHTEGGNGNTHGKMAGVIGPCREGDSGSAARFFYCAKASKADRDEGCESLALITHQSGMGGAMPVDDDGNARDRFKAQSRNHHPTVKPTDLMRYLCRLVTPPGGTVLDPFMGSGSTGKAALAEGFNFIGIERDPQYFQIAQKRAQPPHQTTLPLP